MALTTNEIEQVAALARLELSEKEKKMYAEQLSVVLDYFSMLNEVNTDNVIETSQVTGLEDVVREDKVVERSEETKQKLIKNFPEKVGRLLKVKAVFDSID
ncbi:MAG: Asp-tRNA(Asn)/Glu-tRNA(Gln) amidotransferase subunit GatC [Patescibacteria group bacterium]